MIEFQDTAIILSVRPHGETGGVASVLTRDHGRATGYVYGAASTRLRGVLEPGNIVTAQWRAKGEGQLGSFTLDLERSNIVKVMDDPVKLTALQSACALVDKTLPEREAHPAVFDGFCAFLESFETEVWAAAYVFWELALLKELGFGLDLSECAATGATEDLVYVSPRSGRAVSDAAGRIYKEKMLALPPFLRGEARFEGTDVLDGLRLTGHFFLHRVFAAQNTNLPDARLRLEEKFSSLPPLGEGGAHA